jgi:hypothetical protein
MDINEGMLGRGAPTARAALRSPAAPDAFLALDIIIKKN